MGIVIDPRYSFMLIDNLHFEEIIIQLIEQSCNV